MLRVQAIIFEVVGCLAEFSTEDFIAIARLYSTRSSLSRLQSGSAAYWGLLDDMEADEANTKSNRASVESLERHAVEEAHPYEDVSPSLAQLRALGIRLVVASSLSTKAVTCFLERFALSAFFAEVWTRDTAGGVKHVPLERALANMRIPGGHVLFITDTASGLEQARRVGVNSILMMNDPDDAMRLTAHAPTGGIVSLHELPDLVRIVAAQQDQPVADTHDKPRR